MDRRAFISGITAGLLAAPLAAEGDSYLMCLPDTVDPTPFQPDFEDMDRSRKWR